MITVADFPTVRLIGNDPAPGAVLLNAPRPLYGETILCDVMGFTVIAPDDERQLDENRRLDAKRLAWTTRTDAVAEVRDWVIAEYGTDSLDGLSDDDLIGMWPR